MKDLIINIIAYVSIAVFIICAFIILVIIYGVIALAIVCNLIAVVCNTIFNRRVK